ncbi:MAG TPA: hypothetical protein VGK94_05485 [Candidatus Polarisedimenticolia bacterium]|jgi:hypothetical protein
MKRIVVAALVVVFAASLGALLAAEGKEGTWHGLITDDGCGKQHMEKSAAEAKKCTLSCAEKGAKLALYDPKADMIYALSDQTKAKEFAGEHVVVKGTMSADGKSITVAEIQKGEGMKEGKKPGK